jgi:hypothetical protein
MADTFLRKTTVNVKSVSSTSESGYLCVIMPLRLDSLDLMAVCVLLPNLPHQGLMSILETDVNNVQGPGYSLLGPDRGDSMQGPAILRTTSSVLYVNVPRLPLDSLIIGDRSI